MQSLTLGIRWMLRRDMPAVMDIERDVFDDPWTDDELVDHLRRRNCIGMVAEARVCPSEPDQIVGYMVYELHKTHIHLLNFAVLADVQRRGVGRAMIEKLVSKLSQTRRTRITTLVREKNLGAQLFFRSCGFWAVDVVRNIFDWPCQDEDAYAFVYRLCDDSADGCTAEHVRRAR